MSDRVRKAVFIVAGAVFAGLLVWGVRGLPGFGRYPGPYGDIVQKASVPERKILDVVTAVMFDYRGLDTLGEEFILFAAVVGVTMLLREMRESEEEEKERGEQIAAVKSDALVWTALWVSPLLFLFGLYITVQAHVSVGGGFQGGIIMASAWLLLYLGGEREAFRKLASKGKVEAVEAANAGAFGAIGMISLFFGTAFLQNILPIGRPGNILSGGTVPIINFVAGMEVAAAFLLLMVEFFKEAQESEEREMK